MALIYVVTLGGILITGVRVVVPGVRALIVNLLMSIRSLASLRVVTYDGAAVFNESC
jgi:hypothetical protein